MRFEKLDLNLLSVLDALLQDRSVSRAAERINLSQSATSSALGRLRQFFDDELLVPRGRTMVLTPRAEELIEPVSSVLAQIRNAITTPRTFDPAVTDRRIVLTASDYAMEVIVAPTLRYLETAAPHLTMQIVPISEDPIEQLERGLTDVVITTDTAISTEHPSAHLFDDDFVVIGWRGNQQLVQPMTLERYTALGHVAARFGRAQVPSFEEWVHRQKDIPRRVEIVVPGFLAVATLVSGSQRIATMHRRLAERLRDRFDLVIMDPPFEIPTARLLAQWLKSAARDPALLWFVDVLSRQAAALGLPSARIPETEPLTVD